MATSLRLIKSTNPTPQPISREFNLAKIRASLKGLKNYGFCGTQQKADSPLDGSPFLFIMNFVPVATTAACLALLANWHLCRELYQQITKSSQLPFATIACKLKQVGIRGQQERGLTPNQFTISLILPGDKPVVALYERSDYVNALAWYREEESLRPPHATRLQPEALAQ